MHLLKIIPRKILIRIVLALLVAGISWASQLGSISTTRTQTTPSTSTPQSTHTSRTPSTNTTTNTDIDHTVASVVAYIRAHGTLPDFYITKRDAGKLGWQPSRKNLCTIAPGRVIGGDVFTNAQRLLPVARGRVWYEADFDYACGGRNAHRILYSSDGLVYITRDHYKTVTEAP